MSGRNLSSPVIAQAATLSTLAIDPFYAVDVLRGRGIPYRLIEFAKRWYLGVGEVFSSGEMYLSDFVDLEWSKFSPSLYACAPKDIPVIFLSTPFDPRSPLRYQIPRLVIHGEVGEDKAEVLSLRPTAGSDGPLVEELLKYLAASPQAQEVGPAALLGEPESLDLDAWKRAFSQAQTLLGENYLQKIVLSQAILGTKTKAFTRGGALSRLKDAHPLSNAYDFPEIFGVSPELLVQRKGTHMRSSPLAGTRPSHLSEELLESAKDEEEHGFVVEHILQCLQRVGGEIRLSRPKVFDTGDLTHLRSDISAELDGSPSALAILAKIFPTPAISGTPSRRASEAVAKIEGSSRGHYGGAVGAQTLTGDGEFYLAIRGLTEEGSHLRIQVGVGITAQSSMTAEFEELETKIASTLQHLT